MIRWYTFAHECLNKQLCGRVARFLAAKYGRLLCIRDVRQGQYLCLLLYYALTRSLQLSHSTTL